MATGVVQRLLVRDSTHGVSERMVTLSAAVAHLLPVEICRRYHIVPIEFDRGVLTMAGPVSCCAEWVKGRMNSPIPNHLNGRWHHCQSLAN